MKPTELPQGEKKPMWMGEGGEGRRVSEVVARA